VNVLQIDNSVGECSSWLFARNSNMGYSEDRSRTNFSLLSLHFQFCAATCLVYRKDERVGNIFRRETRFTM
jgi:hypothetical protein